MKYTVLFLLCGCAGLQETALPRAAHTLDGLKSFYAAVCEVPPPGKEQVCEDGRGYINEIGGFYNEVNQIFGDSE